MFGLDYNRSEKIEQEAAHQWRVLAGGKLPLAIFSILPRLNIILESLPQNSEYLAEFDLTSVHPPYRLKLKRSGTHRDAFTIAHELGHFFLHPAKQVVHRETPEKLFESIDATKQLDPVESEANLFAAGLLMPKEIFVGDLEEIEGDFAANRSIWLETLCQKYRVSKSAVDLRLARLRSGSVLSGMAWLRSGQIRRMIPSIELDATLPSLASAAWRSNAFVAGFSRKRLPMSLLRCIQADLKKVYIEDSALQRVQGRIALKEIFPGQSGEAEINVFGTPNPEAVFFEIVLDGIAQLH